MKAPALILLALSLHAIADPVDDSRETYEAKLRQGTLALNTAHITELERIKANALKTSDLPTANKADARIKEIKLANERLADPLGSYPANQHYRMTWSNGVLGSEHSREIVCKFRRTSRLDAAKGTLTLVLKTAGAYSNTPNDVLILDGSKGKQIALLKGMSANSTKRIPLTLSAADDIEIAIVNHGHEAIHLKPFGEKIPELFLEVTQ